MPTFLHTQQTQIVLNGQPVILHGVNLGGWLMMEGYIMHALNIAEQVFKKGFVKTLGKSKLKEFENDFRTSFITEEDFRNIASLGFNCVRVPFHYRLIEKISYRYDREGLKYLDQVIAWGEKYRLWIILDLHAAWGSQNNDWHSDSLGQAKLWTNKEFQKRTVALWKFLAARYKDKEWVAGYDILNEAVLPNPKVLNAFYHQLIKAIRSVDTNHILFVEGSHWAQDLECLDEFKDDNLVLSIHYYEPMEFTFNLIPHLTYPLHSDKGVCNGDTIRRRMEAYKKISEKRSCPIYVGEFGVNYRQAKYGEDVWLKDVLAVFKEFGFHWTYWTYKAIKNSAFPDGVLSYMNNPPWVNRQGPKMGWDNYAPCWPESRKEMIESWHSRNFSINTDVLNALTQAAKS